MANEIARNLRALRGDRTYAEFAKLIGAPTTTYRSYESGVTEPKSDFIVSVCRRFNVTAEWLLGMPTDPKIEFSDEDFENVTSSYARMDDEGRRILAKVARAMADSGNYDRLMAAAE